MDYFRASIEYERIIFYSKDVNEIIKAKYSKALCYRFLNDNERAVNELQNINIINLNKSLREKIIYERVFNLYCLKKYNEALINIERFSLYENKTSDSRNLIPYNILCLNSLMEWDKGRKVFIQHIEGLDIDKDKKNEYTERVGKLYSKKNIPKYYNPEKASNLSRFIPGAGQFYTGNIKEGFFAFGMNAGLAALGIYHLYYKYYFTAYVVGFGLFYESYSGGMRRVEILAESKNTETMDKFNKKCIALLIEIYSIH